MWSCWLAGGEGIVELIVSLSGREDGKDGKDARKQVVNISSAPFPLQIGRFMYSRQNCRLQSLQLPARYSFRSVPPPPPPPFPLPLPLLGVDVGFSVSVSCEFDGKGDSVEANKGHPF